MQAFEQERVQIEKVIRLAFGDIESGSLENYLAVASVILEKDAETLISKKLKILQHCFQPQRFEEKIMRYFQAFFPSVESNLLDFKRVLAESLKEETDQYNQAIFGMFPWLSVINIRDIKNSEEAKNFIEKKKRLIELQKSIRHDPHHHVWQAMKEKIALQIIPLAKCGEKIYNPFYSGSKKDLHDFSFWGGFRLLGEEKGKEISQTKFMVALARLEVLERIADSKIQINVSEMLDSLNEIQSYLNSGNKKNRQKHFEQTAIKVSVFHRRQEAGSSLTPFDQFNEALRDMTKNPGALITPDALQAFYELETIMRYAFDNPEVCPLDVEDNTGSTKKSNEFEKFFLAMKKIYLEKCRNFTFLYRKNKNRYQEKFILNFFLKACENLYKALAMCCIANGMKGEEKELAQAFFQRLQFNRLQKKARIQKLSENITYGDAQRFIHSDLPLALSYEGKGRDMAELMSYLDDENRVCDFSLFSNSRDAFKTAIKFLHPYFTPKEIEKMVDVYFPVISSLDEILFAYIEIDRPALTKYFLRVKNFLGFWKDSVVGNILAKRKKLGDYRLKNLDSDFFVIVLALPCLLIELLYFLSACLLSLFRLPFFIFASMYHRLAVLGRKASGTYYTQQKFFKIPQFAIDSYFNLSKLPHIDRFMEKRLIQQQDIESLQQWSQLPEKQDK